MLANIMFHEIQKYIKTQKFMIGFLVMIGLVVLSTVINLRDYKARYSDYREALLLPRLDGNVYRPPQFLSIFAVGKDAEFGTTTEVGRRQISIDTTGYAGESFWKERPLAAGLSSFDLAFLVKTVFSLIVIFFAFDAIAGEKTGGTLKQTLANDIPRVTVIMGKVFGGLIIVLSSLAAAAVVSLLIIALDRSIMPSAEDWIRMLGMFGVSALYLSVMFMVSVMVSVIVNRPSTAIMILLQVWLLFTFIYPNVSVVLARKYYHVPTEIEFMEQQQAATQEFGRPETPEEEAEGTILMYRLDREYQSAYTRQAAFARTLAILSPAVLYDDTMIRLAKTGMAEYEKFLDNLLPFFNMLHDTGAFDNRNAGIEYPAFIHTSEDLRTSAAAVLPNMLILFLFGTISFTLTHALFQRKDVR
jgi:ABC-type transport system involved in multi-copper enzyme maturation permease subunit